MVKIHTTQLTQEQAMRFFGVGRKTLYKYRKKGTLKYIKKSGKVLYLVKIAKKDCRKMPCVICGYSLITVPHHIYGRRNSDENVRMCGNCHALLHWDLAVFIKYYGKIAQELNLLNPLILRRYRQKKESLFNFQDEYKKDPLFPYRFVLMDVLIENKFTIKNKIENIDGPGKKILIVKVKLDRFIYEKEDESESRYQIYFKDIVRIKKFYAVPFVDGTGYTTDEDTSDELWHQMALGDPRLLPSDNDDKFVKEYRKKFLKGKL